LLFQVAGGWHGRERCGFQAFQKSGPRLRTDDSGNCVSSALIVTGCCKPTSGRSTIYSRISRREGFFSPFGKQSSKARCLRSQSPIPNRSSLPNCILWTEYSVYIRRGRPRRFWRFNKNAGEARYICDCRRNRHSSNIGS
jgi:hypothetical protein